jgi:hypothetical protein
MKFSSSSFFHLIMFWQILKLLKVLNFKGSKCLTQLPNFLRLPHLEMLILEDCTSLVDIHESIGHLEKLVLLNLQGCENLKNLPESISNLYSLETLNLSDCIKIDKLPNQLGNMVALTELHADGTAIKQLPYSFSLLKKLKTLSLHGWKGQSSESWMSRFWSWISPKCTEPINLLPISVSGLCSLRKLNLGCCNLSDDEIPIDLGSLSSLEELNLSGNKFRSLPRCIGRIAKLSYLVLRGCRSLQSISELPASLRSLEADGCSSLQSLPNVPNQESSRTSFYMDNCYSLAYDFRKSLLQVLSLSLSLSFFFFTMHVNCFFFRNSTCPIVVTGIVTLSSLVVRFQIGSAIREVDLIRYPFKCLPLQRVKSRGYFFVLFGHPKNK